MIELKLDDINSLFPYKEAQEESQKQFPNDPQGDLLIKIKDGQFHLQKNILGKNSAYFGQIATVKYLQMIEIQDQEIDPETFNKLLKVLYGFVESFQIENLEKIFLTLNFLRSKDLKSCLIGEIKKLSKKLSFEVQLHIFQFSFEKQILTLSSYFMELFQKAKLVENFEKTKNYLIKLQEKEFTILMSYLFNFEIQEGKQEVEIMAMYFKMFDYYCQKNHLNNNQLKQKFEQQVALKKEKQIQKEDQKKDVSQLAKEIRDLRNHNDILIKKVDEMKKLEKKHSHIITNLTQKMKLIEKAILFQSNEDEEIKNILKQKKNKKSQEKSLPKQESNTIIVDKNSSDSSKISETFNGDKNLSLQHNQNLNNERKNQFIPQQMSFYNRNKIDIQLLHKYYYNDIILPLQKLYGTSVQQAFQTANNKFIYLIFDGQKQNFQLIELFKHNFKGTFQFIIKTTQQTFGVVIQSLRQGKYCEEQMKFFHLDPFKQFDLKTQYKNQDNILLGINQLKFGEDLQILIQGKNDCNLFNLGESFDTEYKITGHQILNLQVFCISE